MDIVRVRDIVSNGQFDIQGPHRIVRHVCNFEHGDKTVTEWDSETSGTLPMERLLNNEVTAMRIEDGYLEIEFDGDEYKGIEDDVIIRTIDDLCLYLNTTVDDIKRDVYENTDCGAWIEWNDESVTVGSIVEGSDAEFDHTLCYPFRASEYDEWIEQLEQQCDEAWHEANDDPENDDGKENE